MARKTIKTMKQTTHKYNMTFKGVMKWAKHELGHVGNIIAVGDADLQYSYAQSVVNGMLHLRDAIYELLVDPRYKDHAPDLQKKHDEVVRVVQHLIKDFHIDLESIKRFNTRHVLSNLNYLKPSSRRTTRRK
jgi:hypothetical protein